MVACLGAGFSVQAQDVDWKLVQKIAPGTGILVRSDEWTRCYFQWASDESLFCTKDRPAPKKAIVEIEIPRAAIRAVTLSRSDDTAGFLALLLAVGGGGGWDAAGQTSQFAGVKIGGAGSLDLQYDRLAGHNGFSTEGSAVIPLFRVPSFQRYVAVGPHQADDARHFVRFYAEPGVGYRAGSGPFGGYSSAKGMMVLFPDDRTQYYLEYQRRFPFNAPLSGDNRLAIGVMMTICGICGAN